MLTQPFLLHALSPLHAGVGHAADVIDLPTARMKATGIPFLPGSSIKGVLRDARQTGRMKNDPEVGAVFGPEDDSGKHAGALVVGDARLLAMPVRSFKGTFAWVSSPLLLSLAKRDLAEIGLDAGLTVPGGSGRWAMVTTSTNCMHNSKLYLEDLDLECKTHASVDAWANLLWPLASPGDDILTRRFAVVDDDTMSFLSETATQIDARNRLNDRRTAADRALWIEESLPPETLLIGLLAADKSRDATVRWDSNQVMKFALPKDEVLQLGGKATVGRGRCRVVRIMKQQGAGNGEQA